MIKTNRLVLAGKMLAILASVASVAPVHAKAGGVTLSNTVLVQQKSAAVDGTTHVALVPARRVVPGDHVIFRIGYRNEAGQPVRGMVVSNPVPANLSYRGPAEGSPAPEVSVDGIHFAPLATLTSAGRPVRPEEVRAVRWAVQGAVPAGGAGQYSYEASVK